MDDLMQAAGRRRDGEALLGLMIVGGCASVLCVRLWLLPGIASWCDEAWTLMIVTQTGSAAFWREVWFDPNAPLYYGVLRLWTQAAGSGDLAMRVPSLICVVGAGLLPIVWPVPGVSRAARATWGALLFCWMPGILFSLEARCYALLLLGATAGTIAFARVLAGPTGRRVAIWCGLSAVMLLTHYLAVFLVATQSVAYLLRHRQAAVRHWPALAAYLPVAAWGAYHLPRLLHWAAADLAWYDRVTMANAWHHAAFTIGPMTPVFPVMILAIVGSGIRTGGRARAPIGVAGWVALAGIAALLLMLLAGAARPMLSPRYLTPVVPSVLLGLVTAMARGPAPRIGLGLLLAPYLAVALKAGALAEFAAEQARFGWQDGSAFIAGARPDRLVFAADSPGSRGADPRSMAKVGAVYLTRGGQRPAVTSVLPAGGGDPHPRLIAATRGAARPAILWFYDRQRGMAVRYPPAIAIRYPGWHCRQRESGASGLVACVRNPSAG